MGNLPRRTAGMSLVPNNLDFRSLKAPRVRSENGRTRQVDRTDPTKPEQTITILSNCGFFQ